VTPIARADLNPARPLPDPELSHNILRCNEQTPAQVPAIESGQTTL
jgi:hypothetical protein